MIVRKTAIAALASIAMFVASCGNSNNQTKPEKGANVRGWLQKQARESSKRHYCESGREQTTTRRKTSPKI